MIDTKDVIYKITKNENPNTNDIAISSSSIP